MGQYETIRGNVADVYVVNDDIASTAQISADKLAASAGGFATGTFAGGTAEDWTGTAAFTVLFAGLTVTAAANGAVTMGSTATATAIMSMSSSAAFSAINYHTSAGASNNLSIITASNSTWVEFAAGASVRICAEATVAGKYFFMWIATPS